MTAATLLAATAGMLWALTTVSARWAMQRAGIDPYVGAMVTVAGAASMVSVLAFVSDHSWLPAEDLWAPMLLGLILPGLVQGIFFKAISDIGASRTGVIVGTVPILSALLAIAFLDETWTIPLAVGTVLTVFGGGLIASGERSSDRVRIIGVVFAVLTALGFAARDVITRAILTDIDVTPLVTAAIAQWTGLVILVTLNLIRAGPDLPNRVRASLPWMLIPATVQTVAIAFLFNAFERGDVTIVGPMNNAAQTIGVVLLGALVLGRTEATPRVVVAVAAVTTGAVLVGTSG